MLLYNVRIMKFLLTHVKINLDRLTVDGMDTFQAALKHGSMKSWNLGSLCQVLLKKQYIIGLKSFLIWRSKRGNPNYRDFGDAIEMKLNISKSYRAIYSPWMKSQK